MIASSYTPIGLDLGRRAIKAVQLRRSGRRTTAVAQASLSRSVDVIGDGPSVEEARALQRLLDRQGFAGDRVVVAMPQRLLLHGTLELPGDAPAAVRHTLAREQFAQMHGLETDSFELSYWAQRPTPADRPMRVRLVGCTHQAAERCIVPLAAVGLRVIGVAVGQHATARNCLDAEAKQPAAPGEQVAADVLIDVGHSACTVCVIGAGRLVYERSHSESGLMQLHQELADLFGLDPMLSRQLVETPAGQSRLADPRVASLVAGRADRLAREVKASLTYVSHQNPLLRINSARLAGGGATLQPIGEAIHHTCGLPVKSALLHAGSSHVQLEHPAMMTAAAAAWGAAA
jgi:type IV pilus assembly protein PilM